MAAQLLFLSLVVFTISGDFQSHAKPYDHSFTHECLAKPWPPQYGGGIVANPEFSKNSAGWEQDLTKAEHRTSNDDNSYLAAHVLGNQTAYLTNSNLENDKLYAFSVWVQIKQGKSYVRAVFETKNNSYIAGAVMAKQGCWSMLKGGLMINVSEPAYLRFETVGNSTGEIWIDSVSLRPFTREEWKSHQDARIEGARKRRVSFQAVDANGQALPDATISIKQVRPEFPFGCAINQYILNNTAYANWFLARGFRYTVFENELKWTTTENDAQGNVNYTLPDAMLRFVKDHGLTARAHTVMWGSRRANPTWVHNMTVADRDTLRAAADNRINSVMNRYKGQFFQWDIVNENMHNSFLEEVIGPYASTRYYKKAHEIDPQTLPFLNEYYTIERPHDTMTSPWQYLEKIWELRAKGYQGPLGIGLQAHFAALNLPFVRASIDVLNSAKLPIWITELDVSPVVGPANQALYFEEVLRELHAHEAVQGILIWGGWWPEGKCYKMCLSDDNFNNLPQGDVVDKIMAEWTYGKAGLLGRTGALGQYRTSLFHGEYEATISHPKLGNLPVTQKFKVVPRGQRQQNVLFKI